MLYNYIFVYKSISELIQDTLFILAVFIQSNSETSLIKGNNKITELRTILQRESQNS